MEKTKKSVVELLHLVDDIRTGSGYRKASCAVSGTEKLKVIAIIDIGVVAMATAFKNSFSEQVIWAIEEGYVVPLYDERLLNEYFTVLGDTRFTDAVKHSRRSSKYDVISTIVKKGILVNDAKQVGKHLECTRRDTDTFLGIVKEDRNSMTPDTLLKWVSNLNAPEYHKNEWYKAEVERYLSLIQSGKLEDECCNCPYAAHCKVKGEPQ